MGSNRRFWEFDGRHRAINRTICFKPKGSNCASFFSSSLSLSLSLVFTNCSLFSLWVVSDLCVKNGLQLSFIVIFFQRNWCNKCLKKHVELKQKMIPVWCHLCNNRCKWQTGLSEQKRLDFLYHILNTRQLFRLIFCLIKQHNTIVVTNLGYKISINKICLLEEWLKYTFHTTNVALQFHPLFCVGKCY